MPPKPRAASRPPGQSSARPGRAPRLSGTFQRVRQSTATPSGTLMKKTQRQEPCSANQPPRTGPTAAVMEVNPDQVPMARPRSCCEKVGADERQAAGHEQRAADALESAGDDQLAGCRAPGRTRRRRGRRARRRRRRSGGGRSGRRASRRPGAARPGRGRRTSTTHCTSASVAPSADCSAGSATLTTVPSMKAMLEPRMVAARIHGAAGCSRMLTWRCEDRSFVARRRGEVGHSLFSDRPGAPDGTIVELGGAKKDRE